MRIPILALFRKSPFEGLKIHANKVKECTWMFKKAIECYIDKACEEYENLAEEVSRLESEADASTFLSATLCMCWTKPVRLQTMLRMQETRCEP